MDSTQLILAGGALLVFLVFAGYTLLRGMLRMTAGVVLLAVCCWLAFLTWRAAPEISVAYLDKPLPAVTLGLPAAVFALSFWVLRKLGRLILNPFGERTMPRGFRLPRTLGALAGRIGFSAFPAGLACLLAAGSLRFAGSTAEVDAHAHQGADGTQGALGAMLMDVKSEIEKALPESLLSFVSPASNPSRVAMAKALASAVLHPDQTPPPVIDPETGQPIPRAIPVDEPDLQDYARSGRFSELLRHPALDSIRRK